MPIPKHPAEVFGYPISDHSPEAQDARQRHWCPFVDKVCDKKSRLIDYPMGVCSVTYRDDVIAVSPRRFRQDDIVFKDVAAHYFGDLNNLMVFDEVNLRGVGNFDFVMVRHKPLSAQIEDFVVIEFQTGQTTSTGKLVDALCDFMAGHSVAGGSYNFGLNLYDIWKRAYTQILNKGVVLENWGHRIYWVTQERVFADLVKRYELLGGLGVDSNHASFFANYNLVPNQTGRYSMQLSRYLSATTDQLFNALRDNPRLPSKDAFIRVLSKKVQGNAQLRLRLE
jgi:hypothetical protein